MRVRRLTGSADFERVRSVGQAGSTPLFVAIAARGVDGPARVGVAAGKRVGGAAQRNRAKRLLREGVRPLYPFIDAGWDVLLLARKPILDTRSTQVTPRLEHVLRRLGVVQSSGSEGPWAG